MKSVTRCWVFALLLGALGLASCTEPPAPDVHTALPGFGLAFLTGEDPLAAPVPTDYYAPPAEAVSAVDAFQGVLSLQPAGQLTQLQVHTDTFGIADKPELQLAQFPPFRFEFTSDGNEILSVLREPQRSAHPYWEIVLEPGRSWRVPSEQGWSRAALPFTLKEKNQNCVHNGLMSFAWQSDGAISRAAWQITSETCLYLKMDMWGTLAAELQPSTVADAKRVIAEHRRVGAARLPVEPMAALLERHPQLDLQALIPAGVTDSTVYGYVVNGIHYRSDCPTRFGPHPYCDTITLPSYSLAKSLFAGLLYLHMTRQWPGFAETRVTELVPECRLPDGRWDDVRMSDLLNMQTGNYDSSAPEADEDAGKMMTFFLAETHAGKVRFSCQAWQRQTAPGSVWVYHTTDDYLLGTAMNAFIRQKQGSGTDMHRDMFYPALLEPLNLSPLLRWTQRTYDETAQPFTAYGLLLTSDDVARIAVALNDSNSVQSLYDPSGLDEALFRIPEEIKYWPDAGGQAYRNGFWGVELSDHLQCKSETWTPYMSGYGGNYVVLFPNRTVYYHFSDSNQFRFRDIAVESNKIQNFCQENQYVQ